MPLCKCVCTYCLGLCMCKSVCTFSHSVSTLVSQRAVSERTGQYYWLFVCRVSPCRSVTLAQPQSLWLRCSDSSSVTSAVWRESWLMARTGKRCRVGSSKAQKRVYVCVRKHREEGRNVHLWEGAVSVNAHACKEGRKRRLQLFLFVCSCGL